MIMIHGCERQTAQYILRRSVKGAPGLVRRWFRPDNLNPQPRPDSRGLSTGLVISTLWVSDVDALIAIVARQQPRCACVSLLSTHYVVRLLWNAVKSCSQDCLPMFGILAATFACHQFLSDEPSALRHLNLYRRFPADSGGNEHLTIAERAFRSGIHGLCRDWLGDRRGLMEVRNRRIA